MSAPRKTQSSDSQGGGTSGNVFDDRATIPDFNTAAITQIIISVDDFHLRSITVHYANFVSQVHGTVCDLQTQLQFMPGEYITTVEGHIASTVISKIRFVTNRGRTLAPDGQQAFTPTFTWGGYGPGMGLLYFSGKEDTHVRSLQATFGTYFDQVDHPAGVTYEREATAAPAQFSVFAQNLMSPTVTLLIGPDNVLFNASQHILCRLPFFRAALQGQFREAAEQKLTMPEDEPQNVAAVIEFLYTGKYTYQYRMDEEPDSGGPAPDLAEGLYHVGVYATAHKYGCDKLEEAALKNFLYVMGHLKGVQVLRLWKGAYAENLMIADVEGDGKLEKFQTELPALLKELYKDERAEVESTVTEYPLLLSDLLRLMVM